MNDILQTIEKCHKESRRQKDFFYNTQKELEKEFNIAVKEMERFAYAEPYAYKKGLFSFMEIRATLRFVLPELRLHKIEQSDGKILGEITYGDILDDRILLEDHRTDILIAQSYNKALFSKEFKSKEPLIYSDILYYRFHNKPGVCKRPEKNLSDKDLKIVGARSFYGC